MCGHAMSAARARCPDCRAVIEIAYEWCPDDPGFVDAALAAQQMLDHARASDSPHPRLLPEGAPGRDQ